VLRFVWKNETSGACVIYGRQERCIRLLVERPEGKGLLRRPRYSWEENIKMNLQELGWAGMDWIDQAQDRDRW